MESILIITTVYINIVRDLELVVQVLLDILCWLTNAYFLTSFVMKMLGTETCMHIATCRNHSHIQTKVTVSQTIIYYTKHTACSTPRWRRHILAHVTKNPCNIPAFISKYCILMQQSLYTVNNPQRNAMKNSLQLPQLLQ